MFKKITSEIKENFKILNSIPALAVSIFILSVVGMNLLANKSIINHEYFAIDCGTIISWIPFLLIDLITRKYGPKASIIVSISSIIINVLVCILFYGIACIPGIWSGSDIVTNSTEVNEIINSLFGGNWYIIMGSAIAFGVSSIADSVFNNFLGQIIKNEKNTFGSFVLRTLVATMFGQLIDNFVFAIIVPRVLFGWTLLQCFTCALFGMLIEVGAGMLFYPLSYRINKKWNN